MWYIESLLVFCLIYALIRQFCKSIDGKCSSKPTIIGLLIVGGLMGIGSYLIRQVSPQDHWIWPFGIIPLPMEPAHYLQYVMMFVIGILARRFAWLKKMSNTTGALSLMIGCLLALGIYLRDGGAWNVFAMVGLGTTLLQNGLVSTNHFCACLFVSDCSGYSVSMETGTAGFGSGVPLSRMVLTSSICC